MTEVTILFAALLPAIVLWVYIWRKDTRPEPTSQLVKAVLYGVVICIPVTITEILLGIVLNSLHDGAATLLGITIDAFFVTALPEEGFKLLALWLVLRKNPYFDEHFDGIVYAVCIGLGFAAVENVIYLFGSIDEWMSVAVTRALLAVPCHYALAVLMGYYYSIYHFVDHSRRVAIRILFIPILAHGIYDTLALCSTVNVYIGSLCFFVLIYFCIKIHKYARARILEQIERDNRNASMIDSRCT